MAERFIAEREGRIFLLGTALLLVWIAGMVALQQLDPDLWLKAVSIGFSTLVLGKPAAVAQAIQAGLPPWSIVLYATYVDIVTVLIAYPVLVFSYRNLFERPLFARSMRRVFNSAQKNLGRFKRCKIAGVFAFVWVPFMMTGVVVGAVLGYLLGLRHWVTLATVSVGALAASVCWVYAYDILFGWLVHLHAGIPAALTAAIVLGIVLYRIRVLIKARRKKMSHARTAGS